jgi:hypothetical protein
VRERYNAGESLQRRPASDERDAAACRLADAATFNGNMKHVTMLLEHCTDYPRFARKLIAGSTGRILRITSRL